MISEWWVKIDSIQLCLKWAIERGTAMQNKYGQKGPLGGPLGLQWADSQRHFHRVGTFEVTIYAYHIVSDHNITAAYTSVGHDYCTTLLYDNRSSDAKRPLYSP